MHEKFVLPLTAEEAAAEVKRIFKSFTQEFKTATVLLFKHKAETRKALIRETFPKKTDAEVVEMAWAEVSLEMVMIMTDAINRLSQEIEDQDAKLKVVAHLMPPVEQGKPS